MGTYTESFPTCADIGSRAEKLNKNFNVFILLQEGMENKSIFHTGDRYFDGDEMSIK